MWFSSATPSDSTMCRQVSTSSFEAHPLGAYDSLVELPVPKYVAVIYNFMLPVTDDFLPVRWQQLFMDYTDSKIIIIIATR